jgi:tRNA dimethylallyltransferase
VSKGAAPDRSLVVAVLGPTGIGKSEIALRLAEGCKGEIVVADSRQVYRELDIATNKPKSADLERAGYHCVGIADPRAPFNVHDFVIAARRAVDEILERGRLPIVEGGTGLYIDALLDGLTLAEVSPNRPRREDLSAQSVEELAAHVRRLDPDADVDLRNRVRLIRAIEILEALGPPLAAARRRQPTPWRQLRIGLRMTPERLAARIRARSEEQIARGLIDETKRALATGVPRTSQVLTGTGYGEAVALIDGRIAAGELVELMVRNNLRLARRQLTWLRRDARIRWFEADDDPLPGILGLVKEQLG